MMYTTEENVSNSVDLLKRELIARYIYLMSSVLIIYGCVFYFILEDKRFGLSIFVYFILIFYTFLVIRKSYNVKTLVHLQLTYSPLYAAFVMLYFWKYSATTCMWLLPVPLGAHIFLEKKYVYIYSGYILAIILAVSILTNFFTFNYFSFNNVKYIVISDTFVCLVNIAVFSLLLYYNEKIKKVEFEERIVSKRSLLKNTVPEKKPIQNGSDENENKSRITVSEKNEDIEKSIALFDEIKRIVESEEYFKDEDFTISKLSYILKVNNLYIAKAIKIKGYSNFNHYLNICRVENVKKLIQENDINKITLMYIYTASGFSNQSTFNRVFKQIEGITPSEYINKTIKNDQSFSS